MVLFLFVSCCGWSLFFQVPSLDFQRVGSSRHRVVPLIGITVLFILMGGTYANWRWNTFSSNEVATFANLANKETLLAGQVISEPEYYYPHPEDDPWQMGGVFKPEVSRFILEVDSLALSKANDWEPVSGKVRVVCYDQIRSVSYGKKIVATGSLRIIEGAKNPNEFDWSAKERASGLLATFVIKKESDLLVYPIDQKKSWTIMAIWQRFRQSVRVECEKRLPRPEAAMVKTLLLGERRGLSQKRQEAFLLTGTVHLLAISGLHVGVILGIWSFCGRMLWLSPSQIYWGMIGVALFYACLANGHPPVVRAFVFTLLYAFSRLCGRSVSLASLLMAAALVLLWVNPAYLFQVGPQLSFIAVGAFVLIEKLWNCGEGLWQKICQWSWEIERQSEGIWQGRLQELVTGILSYSGRILWISLMVWGVTLPLVAWRFHVVAPMTIVLTPLLSLLLIVVLVGTFGMLTLGRLGHVVSEPFLFLTTRGLGLFEKIVLFSERLPGSGWYTAGPFGGILLLYYFLLIVYLIGSEAVSKKSGNLIAVVMLVASLLLGIGLDRKVARYWQEEHLAVTFVAVGHGNSVLVEFPNGKNILYDAGAAGSGKGAADKISAVLWSRGITTLDGLFLSHADFDHYNGVPWLTKRFSIRAVYVTPPMQKSKEGGVLRLWEILAEQGIPVKEISEGKKVAEIPWLDVRGPTLSGPREGNSDDNADSLVAEIRYGGRRLLLPGDLQGEGLAQLLQTSSASYDLVMAPHHGSSSSNGAPFCYWANAKIAVVSAKPEANLREVRKNYLDAGCEKFFHLGKEGAVLVEIEPHGAWEIYGWRKGKWEKVLE
ncbi:MAG: ComEC/Rec2 family competence protein [Pirellulaceae bacterium]|nr:ComEC/Rec2 family competence protein [Pirellulaceae bacterium]